MKKFMFNLSAISLALFSVNALAEQTSQPQQIQQTQQTQKSSYAEIEDSSLIGVTYEMDENGEVARIRATGEAELVFGDRKDIRSATQKAQMRAKANIAKFLSERVTSEEVMDYAEKIATQNNNQDSNNTRETIENKMETIKNSADELLRGVVTTKTDINKDEKYVQVEVGLSLKSQAAASKLKKSLNTEPSENGSFNSSSNGENSNGGGREVKKSKNYDSF